MAILNQWQYCYRCGATLAPHASLSPTGKCRMCADQAWPVDGLVRVGPHEGLLRQLVLRFKFRREQYLLGPLTQRLAWRLQEDGDWLDQVEAFVPIPMHWLTRLMRANDHTALLVAGVGELIGKPATALLSADRMVRRQVGLNATERVENVKGLFGVRKGLEIGGSSLCLIDDVTTTGATLCEAARTLKSAGARKVYAAVLAKSQYPPF